MKKNGFVFIETIVAIVVLTSSLLLLYSTFNKVLQSEKTRVYYDDMAYIYRSYYLRNNLNDLNMVPVLNDLTNNNNNFFVTVGVEYQDLFKGRAKEETYFRSMLEYFDVEQMIIIKENKLDNLKRCTLENSMNPSYSEYENCNGLYSNLSEDFITYLKTIYIDVSCTYVLAVEYNTCQSDDTNCRRYYSWVSV